MDKTSKRRWLIGAAIAVVAVIVAAAIAWLNRPAEEPEAPRPTPVLRTNAAVDDILTSKRPPSKTKENTERAIREAKAKRDAAIDATLKDVLGPQKKQTATATEAQPEDADADAASEPAKAPQPTGKRATINNANAATGAAKTEVTNE